LPLIHIFFEMLGKFRKGRASGAAADSGVSDAAVASGLGRNVKDDDEASSSSDGSDVEELVDLEDDKDFLNDGPSKEELEKERQAIVKSKFDILCQVPFFARFPKEHQERLFEELKVEHYKDGDLIVKMGAIGDRMYIIIEGEAVVWREDVGDITHIYQHDYFGEQALVYGQERNSNVSAIGDTTVMYLSKEVFEKFEDIRTFMVVQKIPLLSKLRPDMQSKIVAKLRPLVFERGDFVVKQGDVGDAFYMIAKGSAEVVENEEITTHLYEGHTFGQMALMSGSPRLASVRASEQLICMELKAKDFQDLIKENAEFDQLLKIDDQSVRRVRSKRYAQRNKSRNASMDSSSSRRYSAEGSVMSVATRKTSAGQMIEKRVVDTKRKGGHKVINGFVLQREIGRGTFGKVRLCTHEETQEQFAIKIIDKAKIKENVSVHAPGLAEMRQEVAIMKRLSHSNIVNLVAVIDDPDADQLYIVTEYCENGALMSGLEDNEPLPEATAREYFRDLLLGLQYLHSQGVIHRDIKPMNLLLTKDNVLKIADFGAARIITGDTKWISGVTGTPAFMAPELLVEDSDVYDGPAVDLWSCGATLFMMVTGKPPWMSDDEIKLSKKVKNDELLFPSNWNQKNYSPYLKNLIIQLLAKDPKKRPTLEEAMTHDWVTEEGSEMLPMIPVNIASEMGADSRGHASKGLRNFDSSQPPALTKEEEEAAIDQLQARNSAHELRGSSAHSLRSSPSKLSKGPSSHLHKDSSDVEDLDKLINPDQVVNDTDLNSDDESEYSSQTNKYDIGRLNSRYRRELATGAEARRRSTIREEDINSAGVAELAVPIPGVLKGGKKVSWIGLRYAFHKEQNNRKKMEDTLCIASKLSKPGGTSLFSTTRPQPAFFAAVYDGHGGDLCSNQLKESLHRSIASQPGFPNDLEEAIMRGCLAFDRQMLQKAAIHIEEQQEKVSKGEARKSLVRTKDDRGGDKSLAEEFRKAGSTALMVFMTQNKSKARVLTCGWLGDSRAVLCRAGRAVALSEDHKAAREDETVRIRAASGTVNRKGQIDGALAVSRSFGDIMHKGHEISRLAKMKPSGPSDEDDELLASGVVISKPDVVSHVLQDSDQFAILATDGLWDVVSNQAAVNFIAAELERHADLQLATSALVKMALEKSVDNITAIVVAFR